MRPWWRVTAVAAPTMTTRCPSPKLEVNPMSTRRSLVVAALAGSALLATTLPTMAGGGFGAPTTLRTGAAGTEIRAGDLAARAKGVVIGWQENKPGGVKRVYIRRSNTGGASFRPTLQLDTRQSRDIQVDVCSGWAWAASTVKEAGSWFVALDKRALVGSEWESSVIGASGTVRKPDVACAGPRLVVAWFRKQGGIWRVKLHARGVNDAAKGDQLPAIDVDLGPGDMHKGLAIAGTKNDVFVSWFDGEDFEFRRFSVGAGPDHDLSGVPTALLPDLEYGQSPKIGVSGDRLVLAYTNEADLRARVSTNRAVSWGPERTLENVPFPSEVAGFATTADVIGDDIIVGGGWVGGVFDELSGEAFVYRTTNDGGSWARVPGTTKNGGTAVAAYRGTGSNPLIVHGWDRWIADPAQHKLRFQRQS